MGYIMRTTRGGLIMSHPVNDEILENLYEEVKEEFPNALEPFVIAEVQNDSRKEPYDLQDLYRRSCRLWLQGARRS